MPALLSKGADVRGLVHGEAQAQVVTDAGAEAVVGDLRKPETLDAPFEGVDAVYLLIRGKEDQVAMASAGIAAAWRSGSPRLVCHSAFVPEPAGDTFLGRQHAAI